MESIPKNDDKNFLSKKRNLNKKKIINFISGNAGKYKELVDLFKTHLPEVEINQIDIDLPELQGEPEEIVKAKLALALKTKAKNSPYLVEDTSLCFNAYKGLPGPYIKYFYKKLNNIGLYKMACAFEDHSAEALSVWGIQKNKKGGSHIFVGRTQGEIVEPKGNLGFGWDPIFKPKDSEKTFGEMTIEEKDKISHRMKGVLLLINYIKEHNELF